MENGTYVAFMPDKGAHYYAMKAEMDEHTRASPHSYHKQWIDTFGTPHDTDEYVPINHQMRDEMTTAAL